jgi:hypothetical protein
MRVEELKERIASCSEGLKYAQELYSNILASHFEPFDMEAQVIYSAAYNSIPTLRVFIKALFASLKNLLFENNFLVNRNNTYEIEKKTLNEEVMRQREQIMALNAEYCRNLSQVREELMINRF